MTLKIAVCDDAAQDAAFLSQEIQKWAKTREKSVVCDVFSSAEAFSFRYAEDKTFDVLLLDVEMPGMSGVELAKALRKKNRTIEIIFVTGYSDYIAEGYEVAALHYLVKPVDESKLFQTLDRAAEKLLQNERYINLMLSGEMVRIPLYEIDFIEVRQNYVTVHAGMAYTVKKTLRDMEKELDGRFFRVGRSAVVNLDAVRRTTKTDVFLRGGLSFPLPRGAYEALNRAIIQRG